LAERALDLTTSAFTEDAIVFFPWKLAPQRQKQGGSLGYLRRDWKGPDVRLAPCKTLGL
jgi:hypothetical protein